MERFETLRSPATPLLLRDVDTDVIFPMRRITSLRSAEDLSRWAFEALRHRGDPSDPELDPDCVLNRPQYAEARILLAGANFGCGSSREPAVWAVKALGYRCIVAPSFGDIFAKNCFQNALLPIVLPEDEIARLAAEAQAPGACFEVDLARQSITTPSGRRVRFEIDAARREQLLEGLDELALVLRRSEEIAAFEARDREARPWAQSVRER